MDKRGFRVYVILGDGENQEGQVWEAAMLAAHYRLDNLVAFVDHNRLQIDGPIAEILSPEPIGDKWRAFGWEVQEINGHDLGEIIAALDRAREVKGRPSLILANTVKGKGCSFMENRVEWHGTAPSKEQMEKALNEMEVG